MLLDQQIPFCQLLEGDFVPLQIGPEEAQHFPGRYQKLPEST